MTTLYLTEARSLVRKDGETLLVSIPEDKEAGKAARKVRVPLAKVEQVVVYGDVTVTSPALAALLEQGVGVSFLSYYGKFRGNLTPAQSKNSLLRLAQFRAHEDPARRFELARAFVCGKLANLRAMLLRANRKREDAAVTAAAQTIQDMQR